MVKRALVTGITGQDGSYLAEFLLKKGYEVHGIKRRSSSFNTGRVDHIFEEVYEKDAKFHLHYGDVTDTSNINSLIASIKPDEIYHLAAQSHVGVSFETPEYTANVDALGTLRILEAIRLLGLKDKTRFYQASTSELYGNSTSFPQNENTPFNPQSPYGVAKLYAFWITKNYREAYNMFAVNGILFNHESERRGGTFVTRKITYGLASVKHGLKDSIYLGNLDAKRDWGHASDYVEAMWMMLQHDVPEDFVVSTGEHHSVRELVEVAGKILGYDIQWRGTGKEEVGIDMKTGKTIVRIDPRYFRPAEVHSLLGDSSKAKNILGWEPKTRFEELVKGMVHSDEQIVLKEVGK